MTLRNYFLSNCIEDDAKIFDNEFEVLYAEGWDAAFFAKKIFHKELNEVSFRDMYVAFKGACRSAAPVSLEELNDDYSNFIEDNKMSLGTGNYRKLNYHYDPNTYEPNLDEQ